MHWLGDAAARAGFKGASTLLVPPGTPVSDAWEIAARALGVTPSELASRLAPAVRLRHADVLNADVKATRLVPEKLARRFNVFPVREDDRQLIVATADP